jgi:type II secretory pathway predicted ATPase ExeA
MYESFYRLQTNPFRLTPDSKFCFSHSGYKLAREYLEYALKSGDGFVMLTGRPGTGKTTLVESFLAALDMSAMKAARIAASNIEPEDLLRAVAYAYDIEIEGHNKAALRHHIQRFFEKQVRAGWRILLIIDEAQDLPRSALQELRLLADLQSGPRQLLQLFLVGQEQLCEQISAPEMDHFQQRVIANYHLVPLDLKESRDYVEYRLRQAGWQGDPELSGAAVVDIYRYSRGVPRHINKLCNRLLLLGYGKGIHTLDSKDVQVITDEMDAEQLRPIETEQLVNETATETLDARAINPDTSLLKDLAIRVEQRTAISSFMSSAATELDGTRHPDRLADQGNAVSPGPALPDPVIRQPSRHRGNWLAGIAITRQQLQSVLAILPVAILSIAAVTGLFENQVSSLRTALPDNSNFSRSPATNAEDQRTIASDNAQLQRILGQELPATAAGHPQGYPLLTEAPAGPPGTPYAGTGQLHDTDELYPVDKLIPDVEVASGSETVLHSPDQFVPAEKKQHVATISSVSDNELLTDALRETEVERLLVQGQQALQDFRLLTPAQDSAYHYFQGALMLSPDNAQAIAGIEQVAERYVFLTNRALEQQDWVKARLYIDRGLSIQPGNSELLALQNSVYEPVVDTDEEIGITAKTVEDQNTDDFLSRVKAFFSAARNSARSDNETIADETSSYLHEQ